MSINKQTNALSKIIIIILLGKVLNIFFKMWTQTNRKNNYFDVITTPFETDEDVTIKSKIFWFQTSLTPDM